MDALTQLKKISTSLIIISLLAFSGCKEQFDEEDCITYNYDDCNTVRPRIAELKMHFTISRDIHSVVFEIYKGTVDNGTVIITDTAFDSEVIYLLPIPEYYSVRAIYKLADKTLYAVDGKEIKVEKENRCDSTCYSISDTNLDMIIQ
jgi:hypothetical protein